MDFDIFISGGGPAGLSLARALSGRGLRIAVAEQQPLAALADPAFDGREIALTQPSVQTMRQLDLWERIPEASKSPLRDARVLNGPSPFAMVIGHELSSHAELGWLVSNHLIRKAAYDSVQAALSEHGDITLLAGQRVTQVHTDALQAQVVLQGPPIELKNAIKNRVDGALSTAQNPKTALQTTTQTTLTAQLLVAADSRFSSTRRALGIAARQHDFGRSMLVCEMTHAEPHHHQAWEWFGYGQTLALLPMNPLNDGSPAAGLHRSSVVLTLPHAQIELLQHADRPTFNADITRRFDGRLGTMDLLSSRCVYPLVGVWPEKLVAQRFACIGDSAVGMHPVTAHGFNFGLLGVNALAQELLTLKAQGRDLAAPEALARYQRRHQRATQPLYLTTLLIARLYTNDRPPARLLRDLALRLGQRLTPFKRHVAATLTG